MCVYAGLVGVRVSKPFMLQGLASSFTGPGYNSLEVLDFVVAFW